MKKSIISLLVVIVMLLGIILGMTNTVLAETPTTKTYTIIYKVDDSMGPATGTGDINGETMVQTTVELTEGQQINVDEVFKEKGFKVFYEGKKFLNWKKYSETEPSKEVETLTTTDFGQVKLGYGENAKTVENAVVLMANFDYEGGYESDDYYYISLNPCKGKINDNGTLKSIVNIIIPKSEFTTVDLTKYVPTGADGYTFTGWYIGESGKGLGYEYKEEITKTDFKENYLYVYGAFLSNSVENAYSGYSISFNANGGTIDGKTVKEYGYVAPNSGYPIYFEKLIPKREGYKFIGWNTKADGSGKNLTGLYWPEWDENRWGEGDWYEVTGRKMTLYATWEKTAETVTPAPTPEENKVTELSTKVENSEVEVKVELEKAVEKGSKLQIVKVAEEKIEEVKKVEEDLKTVFDINVVSNTGDIIKIEDNKMQIKILLEEDLRGYKNYQVVYIKDGKIVEEMPTKIEGNYIVFETTHLSEYGIVANNNEKVEEAQKPQTDNKETQEEANKTQNPQTGDNVVVFGIIFVVAVLGLAISTIISKKK